MPAATPGQTVRTRRNPPPQPSPSRGEGVVSGWRLTLDAVAHYPRPGANAPAALSFSPDGRLLTYLFSEREDLIRDLWALDVETGERRVLVRAPGAGSPDEDLSPEEALRRERQRLREGGVTQYSWARDADRLLVPLGGRLFVTSGSAGPTAGKGAAGSRGRWEDSPGGNSWSSPQGPLPGAPSVGAAPSGPLREIAPGESPIEDARLTADGQRVVFVRARDLWAAEVEASEVWRLTSDATETVANGLAEYIAQEEMGRSEGFWISRDGARVAFARIDDGHIPAYPILHQGERAWRTEVHRYPFPGAANARVRLGVVPITGGDTRWMDLGEEEDIYLARVDWRPDGSLAVQVETRDQRRLQLWCCDPDTGARTLLLEEHGDPWINLHSDLRFIGDDGTFVWSSERTGYRHLSLHGPDGRLLRALTGGDWPVDRVVHVDEGRRIVYFLAGRESPLERHLYRVSLDGGEPIRLTEEPGFHAATFARDGARYVHVFESRTRPPSVVVRSVPGARPVPLQTSMPTGRRPRRLRSTQGAPPVPVHTSEDRCAPGLRPPELVQLAAGDGTRLYGAIYHPRRSPRTRGTPTPSPQPPTSTRRLPPLVVSVYGGPHAQTVTDTWGMTVDLRAQYLASLGFLVFKLDNRGSARRGLAFEAALHRRMGTVEVEDQVEGVRWLVGQGLVDPERVGIYGWSYGGYLALMCLLTAPDVFQVAVAGAPVTDWDGYDTHYTERYMGTPAANPDGYREGSVLTHAARLRGKLLLVHGMVDENVHFRHTARLIIALEEAGRPYDLAVFPEERHMPRGEAGRRYLEERVAQYLRTHLRKTPSPAAAGALT